MTRPRPPVVGRPMHEFFAAGWLHEINRRVAYPLGVVLGMSLNDDELDDGTRDDGTLVHGWQCVPYATSGLVIPPLDARIDRMAAFDTHIRDVRGY